MNGMGVIGEQAVRDQLERIVSSPGFVQSERLCRFLRFAVESKLSGDGERMKEYVLGREVFDRGEDYDPRLDPIVRVEARRLRAKLEEYYAGAGRMDAVRIEVPKGGYEAIFRPREAAPGRSWIWAVIALAAVLMSGILYWQLGRREAVVLVMPASWMSEMRADSEDWEKSLAESLAEEMVRTGASRVVAWPLVQRYFGEHREPLAIGRELGASRMLLVSVRGTEGLARVSLILVDAKSNNKLWVWEYAGQVLVRPQDRADLVRRICVAFAEKKR